MVRILSRKIWGLLLWGVLAAASWACQQSVPGTTITLPGSIDRERAIVLARGQPLTLDPAVAYESPAGIVGHVFSGLVTLDTDLQIQPDLAHGWDVSANGITYTFYLRDDVQFHDGRPFTAEDVAYSWNRALAPDTQSDTAATYLNDIVGAKAVLAGEETEIAGVRVRDTHILEVEIDAPKRYFLAKLSFPATFIVDADNVAQSEWDHAPNGTGPYALESWDDDEMIILRRVEGHYSGGASAEHVVYLLGDVLPLSAYELGEIDLAWVGGANLARVQDPNSSFYQDLQTVVDMCTTYLGLDVTQPPFDDVRVRQAFNYALDKERLMATFFDGQAFMARGFLPPNMPGYVGDLEGYPYNPERARKLLAEAGYTAETLPRITFHTSGYDQVDSLTIAMITLWEETLGVTVEPVLMAPETYWEQLYAGNHGHMFNSGWCADYPDPQNFLESLLASDSSQNMVSYANPAFDALLAEAGVEPDIETRLALYAEAERLAVADAPVIFLQHDISAVVVSPRLQGYQHTPIGVAQWHRVELSDS